MSKSCVLMFSGGRDSTLAAMALHEQGYRLVLVTVTSPHLVGMDRVHQRLLELRRVLPGTTEWLNVAQPGGVVPMPSGFSDRTCLPCQEAYALTGYKVARDAAIKNLALGYANYQSGWPEQTPAATARLDRIMGERGLNLLLPVYGLRSKNEAIKSLDKHGLAHESLEQKCTKQVSNIVLEGDALEQQLGLWEQLLTDSLAAIDKVTLVRLRATKLGAL